MNQPELWIGLVNLKPLTRGGWPLDLDPGELPPAGAFTNIVTWAFDVESFRHKSEVIAATLEMYVLDIESVEPLAERTKNWNLTEEIEDMVQRAEFNPDAIVYGTFFTYPFEDA